jgi:hypothetical protein
MYALSNSLPWGILPIHRHRKNGWEPQISFLKMPGQSRFSRQALPGLKPVFLFPTAAQGFTRKWKLRQERLSPCFTTHRDDLIAVRC